MHFKFPRVIRPSGRTDRKVEWIQTKGSVSCLLKPALRQDITYTKALIGHHYKFAPQKWQQKMFVWIPKHWLLIYSHAVFLSICSSDAKFACACLTVHGDPVIQWTDSFGWTRRQNVSYQRISPMKSVLSFHTSSPLHDPTRALTRLKSKVRCWPA